MGRRRRRDLAALYYPWINVFDPGTQLTGTMSDGSLAVPPSGHIAGIYARVDTERGVFKAPANEVVRGALGVTHALSRADQDGLNPKGVNAIRVLNGNILVWGARTVGGDANGDLKYISVRRTLLFLRESIEQGTQWAVFEPNTPALWAKISRNVTAFLTTVWRSGALFGNTPQEAFFVKCDAENQSAGPAQPGPGRDGDRRRDRAAGGIRDLPHQPVLGAREVSERRLRWRPCSPAYPVSTSKNGARAPRARCRRACRYSSAC